MNLFGLGQFVRGQVMSLITEANARRLELPYCDACGIVLFLVPAR